MELHRSGVAINEVERLEQQVQNLSAEELAIFRAWFLEFDARLWDRQIAEDLASGKLDDLISEAREAFKAGKAHEI
jgi:hypothetical protein